MLYNDAYSVFAGGRHPHLLGSPVRQGWPEVAEFNDNRDAVTDALLPPDNGGDGGCTN